MDRIDRQGYRANVGIILTDSQGCVLIAGRVGSGGSRTAGISVALGDLDGDGGIAPF